MSVKLARPDSTRSASLTTIIPLARVHWWWSQREQDVMVRCGPPRPSETSMLTVCAKPHSVHDLRPVLGATAAAGPAGLIDAC